MSRDDVAVLDTITVNGRSERPDMTSRDRIDNNDKDSYDNRWVKPAVNKLSQQPKEPQERIDKVYAGFPTGKGFYIVIHEYKDTIIGHTNVEFVHNSKRDGWFGANIEGMKLGNIIGGIKYEYDSSQERIRRNQDKSKHSYKIIEVSQQDYNKALSQAKKLHADNTANRGDYDIIGKAHNCVDFVIDTLKNANIKNAEKEVADFMKGTSLANGYAEVKALMARGVERSTAYERVFSGNSEFKQFKHINHNDIPNIIGKYSHQADFKATIITGGSGNDTYDIDLRQNNVILSDSGGLDTLHIKQDSAKLLLRKSNNDLLIIDKDSQKNLIVQDWFNTKTENVSVKKWRGGFKRKFVTFTETRQVEDNSHKIEKIIANGKHSLSYGNVDKLVEAMAIFRNDGGVNIPPSLSPGVPNPEFFERLGYIRNSWEEIK